MQKELENIELELSTRIYKLYLEKFKDNKSAFARACNCKEATIRRIFRNEQGITANLLFRICFALDIKLSALVKDLEIKK